MMIEIPDSIMHNHRVGGNSKDRQHGVDEEEFNVDDYAGGQPDDAFYGGVEPGKIDSVDIKY